MDKVNKIITFPPEDKLSDEEFEDFEPIVTDSIKKICALSDKHNIDRDSMLAYFGCVMKAISEIATIADYEV